MSPRDTRRKRPPKDVPRAADARAASSCCNRFQFTEGFLLDTVTGELWKFNKAAGVLLAIPREDTAAAGGPVNHDLIMEQLQKAADALAQMRASIINL